MAYIPEIDDEDDEINEWQHVQHPFLHESTSTVNQSSDTSNNLVLHSDRSGSGSGSVSPEDGQSSPPPPSPESEIPIPIPIPSESEWRMRVASVGWKMLKVRLEGIREGVVRVVSRVRDCAICVGAFWSIAYVTGVALAAAAMVVCAGIRRRRRRLRIDRQRWDHMASLLKEKDERISELLLQIAHLNEVLSSRRSVPVLRISSG